MKKKSLTLLLIIIFVSLLYSCSNQDVTKGLVEISYFDGISNDGSYNSELFYRNDLQVSFAADPDVIWVSEEQDITYGGYFYMYITGKNFPCYRSKDLNNWEYVGQSFKAAEGTYILDSGSWWAPEVVYDTNNKLYYMYYNTTSKVGDASTEYSSSTVSETDRLYLGVAVSTSPVGPFIQYTGYNALGEYIYADTPPFNFQKQFELPHEWSAFDAHLYISPSKELYLYFGRSTNSYNNNQCIWGMKMIDYVTPNWDTLVQLTMTGYESVKSNRTIIDDFNGRTEYGNIFTAEYGSTNVNEAPYMIEHKGKYYLTYSPFALRNRDYSVYVAVSDSPLGVFEKISTDIANPVIGIDSHMDHMGGTGHHSLIWVGEELFSIYHAHNNRSTGESNPRAIAIDKLFFVYNEELGYDILYCNGPTYSLQPLAAAISGYKNLAPIGVITATNIVNQDTIEYLNDQLFVTHSYASHKETQFNNNTVITIDFESDVEVSAIMVYNSFDYFSAFKNIDSIVFTTTVPPLGFNGIYNGKCVIKNIHYSDDYINHDSQLMRPGGSALAEFAPMKVTKIEIYISSKLTNIDKDNNIDKTFAIGDIVILGKE